jgi:hypothetical protein
MSAEVDVNRASLISWAKVWDAQSTAMGGMATDAGDALPSGLGSTLGELGPALGLPLTPVAPGVGLLIGDYPLFQNALDAYRQVCPQTATLAGQGGQQMAAIADALVTAARRYDDNEQSLAQASHDADQ